MARTYGQIATSIWNSEHFRSLPMGPQHTYLMLITQPDISSVGTLPMTMRRWAGYSNGTLIDDLSDAIEVLINEHFIVIDWAREELLVRGFVRWDAGYKNPKRLLAIQSAAMAVFSPLLKSVLAGEMDRLGIKHTIQPLPIERLSNGYRLASDSPRVVVTKVGTTHNPQPATSNPQHTHPPKPPSSAAPKDSPNTDPWLFTEFWNVYPKKVGKQDARKAWGIAARKANPDEIVAGAKAYANGYLPDREFIPHPARWLNGGRWADEPATPPKPAERRSTTEDRMNATLALTRELAAEEANRQQLQIGY